MAGQEKATALLRVMLALAAGVALVPVKFQASSRSARGIEVWVDETATGSETATPVVLNSPMTTLPPSSYMAW
ncbi:hypothetical protein D3C86_1963540 [compost metagenome]